MISVYVRNKDGTVTADRVEPEWLLPASGVTVWVDITAPTAEDGRLLSDVFHFHPLSVDDALSALQFPKIESYPGYLYMVLHGIDVGGGKKQEFATRDVDFFLGSNYLVTVHDGHSRSIARLRDVCPQHDRILGEGPVALTHRIVDAMVDHYRPAVDAVENRIDTLEEEAILGHEKMARQMVRLRRDLAFMRRVLTPQRDVIGRLARREFPAVSDEMAFRFRDVYDHVVRSSEEAILFQDRVTGILEVNLATVSNRLNRVMQVLTVMSTIFLPLTVLTGMWGMNIPLPHLPGGESAQFWWVLLIMTGISLSMLAVFRRLGWL
ncbi:MAG TPA: magnesium transporter CorA family protein [Vicinamibacterales bacterium]|nr:magnesium transporter CorA family protein [Vicinamibacterales bacterium]